VRGYSTILSRLRIERSAVLAGPTTPALERHDAAFMEDLATPDTTWLPALYRADQTHLLRRTSGAQRLGELEVSRDVSEPEIGIVHLTWQSDWGTSADRRRRYA
jgi:hypothetical protein